MRYVVKLGPDLYWSGRPAKWTGNYSGLADATRFRSFRAAQLRLWKFRDENPDHFAVVEFFSDSEFVGLLVPATEPEEPEYDEDDE